MDSVIQIGKPAPNFQLPDSKGEKHSLAQFRGQIVVLNFWSAECAWCDRVDRELVRQMKSWNVSVKALWIACNANETTDFIEKVAIERKLTTVLLDAHQLVADLYGAKTTPHFFVVDSEGKLAYQGAWDDVTFKHRVATRHYVPQVIETLLNNQALELRETSPYGCALVRWYEGLT